MANEYVDLSLLKSALGISDTTRDTLLNQALSSASRSIDRVTGRRFYLDATATARTYNANREALRTVDGHELLVDDIGDTAGMIVETGSGSTWTATTEFENWPGNAIVRGFPVTSLLRTEGKWPTGSQRVRITARWGWPAVPDEVVQATLILAQRLFKRKDSPEGVIGSAEWGTVRLSRVDHDVMNLVEHFARPGFN